MMKKFKNSLPVVSDQMYLSDGGLETSLIFMEGIELPEFAAFVLLENEQGCEILIDYYRKYLSIAIENQVNFILESPTWRANIDWGAKLGYSSDTLAKINSKAIWLLKMIRDKYETETTRMLISGCIGPRGDGYIVGVQLDESESQKYHLSQIAAFSKAGADMVSAFTITYSEEAIGIAHAAKSVDIPVVISFTVETDGKLPSEQTLKDAIETVDKATDNTVAYYMINCAHPDHFKDALSIGDTWQQRIHGIRANASKKSHAELDEAEELDDGNPTELARMYRQLRKQLCNLNVLGGCCGTDHRHVQEIFKYFS